LQARHGRRSAVDAKRHRPGLSGRGEALVSPLALRFGNLVILWTRRVKDWQFP